MRASRKPSIKNAANKFREVVIGRGIIKLDDKDVQSLNNITIIDESDAAAAKELCHAITHFRKALVKVLGVPPMHVNSDKANALTAALLYQNINTLQNQRSPEPPKPEEGSPEPPNPEEGSPEPPKPEEGSPEPPNPEEGSPEPPKPEEGSPEPIQPQARRPEDNKRYLLLLSLLEDEF